MSDYELPSRRIKRDAGELPETFIYDEVPMPLRQQVIEIMERMTKPISPGHMTMKQVISRIYSGVNETLKYEYGLPELSKRFRDSPGRAIFEFLLHEADWQQTLDVIELFFRGLEGYPIDHMPSWRNPAAQVDQITAARAASEAITELNKRFLIHGIGYQYESGFLMRIDSTLAHQEIVRPTLNLLNHHWLKNANDEYLLAERHFRDGEYGDCLSECLKAFETTMKLICDKRKWQYDTEKHAAAKLVGICISHNLVPKYLEGYLAGGVTTIRNREDGHGQGMTKRDVPEHLAAFQLHTTAANILLLVEAEKALP